MVQGSRTDHTDGREGATGADDWCYRRAIRGQSVSTMRVTEAIIQANTTQKIAELSYSTNK